MELADPQAFYDALRKSLFAPKLTHSEVEGCDAIRAACLPWPLAWEAYAFATAYHETAHTMQPIREYGSDAYLTRMYDPEGLRPEIAARLGNTEKGDGVTYCGRGYVQLTGRGNYARAERELGKPFVATPQLAMAPCFAADIMVRGMEQGWFTGRKLEDFLPEIGPATRAEFMAARRVINGQDKADLIADYAITFQNALSA